MAFNIFGRPTKDDIRVGYIDPDGGFIDGLTVCDANLHAKNNPGTTFIFRTRECIKYLNINEVNALTPNDLIGSSGTLGCEGIQLDIASSDLDLGDLFSLDTNQVARSPRSVYGESIGGSSSGKKDKKCGPLKVNFFGGGGVGVQGNPIVGTDGSLLAVDLIRGGYGYQYAPLTKVEDNCGRGVGSVVRSIIGISSARGFQYYDAFEDFEDYQLCVSDEAPAVPKFSTDGSIVGIWDPRVYASLNEDPIRRQIKEYQEFLQQLTKPWWTTQKEAPLKVTSSPKIAKGYNNSRSLINVTDGPYRARQKALGRLEGAIGAGHIWNDFMNKYAVSPVPPSNAVGSDFGTFDFQFEWEEDFPYDGIYTIRGCGDGEVKDLWILPDGEEATSDNKLMTLAGYNQKPVKKKRNYKAGVHRILIALRNGQQFKEIQEEVVVSEEVTETINTVTRTYPIDYKGLNPSNDPIRVKDNGRRIELKDSDKNDANATFRIISTSSGVNARFSSDGRSLEVQGSGNVTIRLEWDDNPFKYDVAVESISVANKTWTQKGKSGKETETIQVTDAGGAIPGSNRPEEKVYRIEVAERESRGRGKFAGVKSVSDRKIKFTDSSSKVQPIAAQDDTDAEFEILNPSPGIQYAKFRGSNDNDLELVVKGSGTITLRLSWKDDPGRNGKAVGNLKVAGAKFNQRGRKGKDTEVIKIDTNVRVAGGTVSETSRTRVVAPRVTKLVSKKVPTRAPWNDNPMGVSVTIDAPLPPILQEPIPPSEDECPPNPFWTTRYPAKDRWWPVNYSDAMAAAGVTKWSDFLSRYAISPVPPLIEEDTDGSGRLWTNTWEIDAPYDGFYQFAVQRDETARIFLDGNLVFDVTTAGDAIWKNLRNKPKLQKVFIKKGKHTINIELSQERFETYTWVDAKIFRTRDWQEAAKPTGAKTVDVNFQVTTSAKFANGVELVGEFAVRKTHGGPQLNESRTRRIETGRVYDVIFKTRGTTSSSRSVQKGIPIEVAEPGSRGRGPLAVIKSVSDSRIRFTDSKFQMDTDASFRILRKDGPDYARFSNDGSQLIVKGKGTVTLELEWDDDKSRNGKAVGNIKVAGEAFRQTGNSGKVTKTINVDATEVSGGQSARAKLKNSGNNVIRMEDSKDSDYNDLVITSSLGRFFDIRGNRCKFMVDFAHSSNANKVVTRKGGDVTYTGPEIFHFKHPAWSTFMNNHSVSPYLPPIDQNNPEINATKRYTWSNVNFPVDGQYKIAFQADNFAKLFIGGVHVATAKQFNGNVVIDGFNMDAGVYDIVVEAGNTADSDNIFKNNPSGFAVVIQKKIKVSTGKTVSWVKNPLAISAILIPPPCPKTIRGKGTVIDVIVEDPGNGYPVPPPPDLPPEQPGYPVALKLKTVEIITPGINYNCGEDELVIEPSNGAELEYKCDTFGRISQVIVSNPGFGFTSTPTITMKGKGGEPTPGVNATFRPQFEVIRDPIVVDRDKLIQVTDLVGLKQTGYVDGRAYYGAVFYKDGVRFAGYYETAGQLVQVYDTLQESIDATVTTPASAIERSGTDVTSNDPRLDIPNTPDELI